MVTEAPLQITRGLPALAVGDWLTVTVVVAVLIHPTASVTVTVYIVVVVGVAKGFGDDGSPKEPAGDQE